MEQRQFLRPGSAGGTALTRQQLHSALAGRASAPPRSDQQTEFELSGVADGPAEPPRAALMPAAVLVPLVDHAGGLTVLLTQRSAHLHHHGGQISFPGGRLESTDASPEAAALRETEEEIGVQPAAIDLLGRLDDYVTATGFHVTPVVGLLRPPLTLLPDPFEVAEIFEMPLSFLMNPINHQRHSRETPDGRRRWFYALPYDNRYVWGATAAMLVNLYELLADRWTS